MSSAPNVERLKGTNWEECHEFIAAIRARALWEGKQRDPEWIADFAAPLFFGKALWWHGRLPQDVRQDWFKLEAAMLDRWHPQEDDDELQINPTLAAAPSLNPNDKTNRPLQGVLKLVLYGSNEIRYVGPPAPTCDITGNKNRAIRVRCNSLSGATLLERIDYSCHCWLGVQWNTPTPNIGQGSIDYVRLIYVGSDTLKSSWAAKSTPFQLIKCTVLASGEVLPVWRKDDSSEIALAFFVTTNCLYIAADPVAYAQDNERETRAKLFLEPID